MVMTFGRLILNFVTVDLIIMFESCSMSADIEISTKNAKKYQKIEFIN